MKIFLITCVSSLLISLQSFSQLSINFPINRAVIQRNQDNRATVQVTGSINQQVDAVLARITPIGNQGVDDGTWHTLSNQSSKGTYKGDISVVGGWYRLEVIAQKGGQTIASSSVDKFGVGEVFVIAGQSNAQGFQGFGSRGATDDRVNCVNFFNSTSSSTPPDNLAFSQLGNGANIAPRGQGPWCWGELGDKLTARLGVPVLFFNAAWSGTLSYNWRESALTQPTWDANFQVFFPYKFPYENLRISLNYYASLLGVRAVLWHQGESDVFPGSPSFNEYVYNLTTLIDRSRSDFGSKVPWMISKVSYGGGRTSNVIISAQQEIINRGINYQTYEGPSTDGLMIPRYDEVHFGNNSREQGLTTLANAWDARIDNFFLSNATPITAKPIIDLIVNCDENNNAKLQIPSGYAPLRWNNGSTSTEQTVTNGTYFATIRDGQGNHHFTNAVDAVGIDKSTDNPIVTAPITSFCEGESLTITANGNFNSIIWNNGQTQRNITISNGGNYSFVGLNNNGCRSASSNTVNLTRNAAPSPPTVGISGNATACDGENIAISVDNQSIKTIWNDGNTSPKRIFTALGEYRFSAKYQNQFGCFSQNSNEVAFSINKIPPKPIINATNISPACVGTPVELSVNSQFNVRWSDDIVSPSRAIDKEGNYSFSAKYVSDANCISPASDEVKFVVNPTPTSPTIEILTATKVCFGDSIRLFIKPDFEISWNDNYTKSTRNFGDVGNYSYTANYRNQFGCNSKSSNKISFAINPNPPKPKIIAETPTTVCDGNRVNLRIDNQSFRLKWSDNSTDINRFFSTISDQKLTAQFENEFGCFSPFADSVRVIVSEIPKKPVLSLLTNLNVCETDTIVIKATAQESVDVLWHDVIAGRERQFTVNQSNNYFARAENKFRCSSAVTDTLIGRFYKNPPKPEIQQVGVYELITEVKDSLSTEWFENTKLAAVTPYLKIKSSGQYEANYLKNYTIDNKILSCRSANRASILIELPSDIGAFWVYPNPSEGELYIESILDTSPAIITLYDANGRLLRSFEEVDFKRRKLFDFSKLQSGSYWIKIQNEAFKAAKRIVINR